MLNFSHLLSQIFNGVQFGVIMALLTTGLSLIFGMIGVMNFAHGSLYMLGAYLVWSVIYFLNIPGKFYVGLAVGFFLMGFVGLLIEKGLMRRIYGKEVIYQFLLTFGILLVIQQGVSLTWGTNVINIEVPSALKGEINLGFFRYPVYYLASMLFGLLVIFAVWFFIERSSWGAIMRACAEDAEMASALGIHAKKVFTQTFILGSALAGLGGGLHAPMIGGIQPTIGIPVLLNSFIILVLGGMGNIRGTLVAGIILGILRGIGAVVWAPGSDMVMFIVMGLILMFRPQGLFGKGN
jgi:branched-chain amino acid transport system permease protein